MDALQSFNSLVCFGLPRGVVGTEFQLFSTIGSVLFTSIEPKIDLWV